jgi:hypothetical protein
MPSRLARSTVETRDVDGEHSPVVLPARSPTRSLKEPS